MLANVSGAEHGNERERYVVGQANPAHTKHLIAPEHLTNMTVCGDEGELQDATAGEPDDVMAAVLANASIAAMDIADGNAGPSVVALLEEIDSSTQRAAGLYASIRGFAVS